MMDQFLELLKIKLVIGWFRVTRKLRSKDQLLAIRQNGSGVKNALIILPEGRENSRIARHFLKSLNSNGNVDLHILMDRTVYHSLSQPLPVTVQIYGVDDVSWFLLPKKELVNRILSRKYHAVVDMHPFFNLSTAYLTYLSKAPLRIGFSSKYSNNFFNIEIERKSVDFIEQSYLSIQKLLNL